MIVDLALKFSSVVAEKRVLNILKAAAKDGAFGEFDVEASSIILSSRQNIKEIWETFFAFLFFVILTQMATFPSLEIENDRTSFSSNKKRK